MGVYRLLLSLQSTDWPRCSLTRVGGTPNHREALAAEGGVTTGTMFPSMLCIACAIAAPRLGDWWTSDWLPTGAILDANPLIQLRSCRWDDLR